MIFTSETASIKSPNDLLSLLNQILLQDKGPLESPFSLKQLRFFSDTSCNKKLYTSFTIPKKTGESRVILSPSYNLKRMQRCINRFFQAIYQPPSCVTGFTLNRSVVDNAYFHVGRPYVFNTDLKDFFTSITYDRVYNSLLIKPFELTPNIAKSIAGICCTEIIVEGVPQVVLPQGAPTSPLMANITCMAFDRKCIGLAKRFGVTYSRYADDISFSSEKNSFFSDSDFMKEFERIIESQHLTINHNKDRIQNYAGRQVVTGLLVNQKVNVSKQYFRDLDNLLFIWERYGREIAKNKFCQYHDNYRGRKGFDRSFESIVKGKLNYLRMIKGEEDPSYNRLRIRYDHLSH